MAILRIVAVAAVAVAEEPRTLAVMVVRVALLAVAVVVAVDVIQEQVLVVRGDAEKFASGHGNAIRTY